MENVIRLLTERGVRVGVIKHDCHGVDIDRPGTPGRVLWDLSTDELYAHPGWGHLWEQFVLAQLRGHFPDAEIFFYRMSNGTEVDFVLRLRGRTVAVECKASSAPAVTRGNTLALDDIRPDRAFVAAPVAASYALSPVWTVLAPADLPAVFDESFAP